MEKQRFVWMSAIITCAEQVAFDCEISTDQAEADLIAAHKNHNIRVIDDTRLAA
jgi:hypothetical protein